jgi:NAD(P)-dependent dehydrogenase (short-subunit alcohol dehydrogenase family)
MIGARNVLRRVSTTQAQSLVPAKRSRGVIIAMISFDFSDRVVIVTGAARGIGRTLVDRFVAAGADVVAADRDATGLADTRESHGSSVVSIVSDITTVTGAHAIVDAAVRRWGRVDVCVNNAAVAPHAALVDERVDVWDTVFAVNCRGTFLMTQTVARAMIAAHRGGRIINFSSAASLRGAPGAAAYASSRAAVEAFSRVAAIELAPHDILVNTVSPGLIDTQPQPLPTTMAARLGQRIPTLPLARPGEPDEVASVVLFLASEASTYMSGSIVHVDGGASIGTRFNAPVVDDDSRYNWVTGRT